MTLATDPEIQRLCKRYARHTGAPDPDDLAAEGILGILEGERTGYPDGVDRRAAAVMWAKRKITDTIKHRSRDRARTAQYAEDLEARDPVHPATDVDIVDELAELLAGLCRRQRSALYLRHGLGLSWPEVGSLIRSKANAARTMADRALAKSRERIAS